MSYVLRTVATQVFPHSTVHEKVELLHKLFPPFMHGARMISGVIYRDVTLYNKMLVEQMHLKVDGLGPTLTSSTATFRTPAPGTRPRNIRYGCGLPLRAGRS